MSKTIASGALSESVRQHAQDTYVGPARRRGDETLMINVGKVHAAMALRNRVPLVCQALKSDKFLKANGLKLISTVAPPSGQSTTVTYTYKFDDAKLPTAPVQDPWTRLRGALKDIFSEFGGGEAYLQNERDNFYPHREEK